jgi:hypothetical protein
LLLKDEVFDELRRNECLFLTLELGISTTSAGISIVMFCHEGALLATGACPLVWSHLTGLIDLVHSMSLGHYSASSFFFGSWRFWI